MSHRALLCVIVAIALAACGGSDAGDPTPPQPGDIVRLTPGGRDPSPLIAADDAIRFEAGALDAEVDDPTTLVVGPDGRLYVGQQNGRIVALTLAGTDVVDVAVIAEEDVFGNVLGLAFNQGAPAGPVTLYVSHTQLYLGLEGPAYAGAIARLTAPAFEPVDVVTGLPVSAAEHGTNGIAFDAAGRLYIAQGGSTNAGVPSERHPRPETPLSGAILVAAIAEPGFDGAVHYEPPDEASDTVEQLGGDVRVLASGFRNPYDVVAHTNGRIYATDNGPNEPDGLTSTACDTDGAGVSGPDELNLIVEGGYYGHPNRNRGRTDDRQCAYRSPGDAAAGVTAPVATLGLHTSSNGLAEYTAAAFGGHLQGDLIYVEWVTGRVWRVRLAEDGASVDGIAQLVPQVFDAPLDVAVGPDGTIYIAEQGSDRISYLSPLG